MVARWDVALPALEEAIEVWRRLGNRPREVACLAELAKGLVRSGRNADGEAASRRALEVAEDLPDGPEKLEALSAQAYLRMLDRDNREAIELGRKAIEMGRDDPHLPAVIVAWNTVGSARILLGDGGGSEDLETSRRLGLEAGNDGHVANAFSVQASALGEMYRFAEAGPVFEAGLRYARERDIDSSRAYLECWLALVNMYRGRWSEAGALATGVLAFPAGLATARMMALLALGRLRARRGDPDVWEALDEALAMAEQTKTLQRIGPVRAARAEAAWLDGDSERSAAEAGQVLELARAKAHPWHVGELAWWLAKAGMPPAASAAAAEPWRLQLDGRWRAAADAWLALECPYEAARALTESADATDVLEALAHLRSPGSPSGWRDRGGEAPRAGRAFGPAGTSRDDTGEPGGPDAPGAGGPPTRGRWPAERRDRGAPVPLAADRRPPRLSGARQARRGAPLRGRRRRGPGRHRRPDLGRSAPQIRQPPPMS